MTHASLGILHRIRPIWRRPTPCPRLDCFVLPAHLPNDKGSANHDRNADRHVLPVHLIHHGDHVPMHACELLLGQVGRRASGSLYQRQCNGLGQLDMRHHLRLLALLCPGSFYLAASTIVEEKVADISYVGYRDHVSSQHITNIEAL